MPKKLSIKKRADDFCESCDETLAFTDRVASYSQTTEKDVSWIHEYAILRMYRSFENFMLFVLIGCLNHDSTTISDKSGVSFPKHLSVGVCQYLITGGGYFDLKGRGGLISELKKFFGPDHAVTIVVKDQQYMDALDKLCALRNFAAHGSSQAKTKAKTVTDTNMSSAGSWLKTQGRLRSIAEDLKALARAIQTVVPM